MKVLLDENMPRALTWAFAPEIEAWTVRQMGWSGLENGNLLAVAAESFDALVTTDRGIPHQQNLSEYAIGIVLLNARTNRIEDLLPLVDSVKRAANQVKPGTVLRFASER
jgi:hypothetical protein